VTSRADGSLHAIAGPDKVVLTSPIALRGDFMRTVAEFTVEEGAQLVFALAYGPSHLDAPQPTAPERALAEAEQFWSTWAGRCTGGGEWAGLIRRSLLTLKALTYAPTGGIVAASTTSLPESLGGSRNWDYRYCWLRDATMTLLALMHADYIAEATAWRDWLIRAIAGSPQQLQIMYGVMGERRLTEWEVPWLPGYEGAAPVRIGNAASEQCQLDVFGEMADALHQALTHGIVPAGYGYSLQRPLLEHLEAIWRDPDEGIWEVRGEPRHFTHSKVMAWVAFDRAAKLPELHPADRTLARWQATRDAIHADVCRHGFDPELGSFVQSYGSKLLDASLLMLAPVGFLPPDDPRIQGTIAAIERRLLREGFVLRYETEAGVDGLPPGEGAFLACSFWLADNYIL
jgi:GH15 family glucan-1,4-alpha-glucosidase